MQWHLLHSTVTVCGCGSVSRLDLQVDQQALLQRRAAEAEADGGGSAPAPDEAANHVAERDGPAPGRHGASHAAKSISGHRGAAPAPAATRAEDAQATNERALAAAVAMVLPPGHEQTCQSYGA